MDQTDLDEKDKNMTDCKDPSNTVKQYEKIINVKNQKVIYIAYKQGEILKRFEEVERFSSITKEAGLCKSIIFVKVNLFKAVTKYPKMQKSALFIYFLKSNFRRIKTICKDSRNQFKNAEGQPIVVAQLTDDSNIYVVTISFYVFFFFFVGLNIVFTPQEIFHWTIIVTSKIREIRWL